MNIVDIVRPDNVPLTEKPHSICIDPGRGIPPLPVRLDRTPDLIPLNQVIPPAYINTHLRIALQAVVPD